VGGVEIVVGVLVVAGLVGSLLPFVPGTPLIFAGALVYAIATDFTPVGPGRLAILAVLTLAASVLGWLGGSLGARRFGGSRWAVVGALVGAVLGVFVPPLGLLIGPMAGAVAGELLRSGAPRRSIRSGLGAVLGVLVGVLSHFVLALVMTGLFVWWTVRG
jgi:uncharacterized protein YqgC (DUF456 family)